MNKQRKSPIQSATLYKVGTKKTGLDGNIWIIIETTNGIKRWKLHRIPKKISKKTSKKTSKKIKITVVNNKVNTNSYIKRNTETNNIKKYTTQYNGIKLFRIIVENGIIKIYTFRDTETNKNKIFETLLKKNEIKKQRLIYDVLLLTVKKYLGFWVGKDVENNTINSRGSSILIQETLTKYIYIGKDIIRFETTEEIIDYVSPIDKNNLCFPIAYSDNLVYFILDYVYVYKTQFENEPTPFNANQTNMQFLFNRKKMRHIYKFKNIEYLFNGNM